VESVYHSLDGGETWRDSPFDDRPLTTFALLIDPAMPQRVLAGTTTGVYRSQDGAHTWQPLGHETLGATVTALAWSAKEPGAIYAGAEHIGLFRSTDGGRNWQPWGVEDASVYAILADPSGALWLGTDQGVLRSP